MMPSALGRRSSWASSFVTSLVGWISFSLIVPLAVGYSGPPWPLLLIAIVMAILQVLILRSAFFLLRMDRGLRVRRGVGRFNGCPADMGRRAVLSSATRAAAHVAGQRRLHRTGRWSLPLLLLSRRPGDRTQRQGTGNYAAIRPRCALAGTVCLWSIRLSDHVPASFTRAWGLCIRGWRVQWRLRGRLQPLLSRSLERLDS